MRFAFGSLCFERDFEIVCFVRLDRVDVDFGFGCSVRANETTSSIHFTEAISSDLIICLGIPDNSASFSCG